MRGILVFSPRCRQSRGITPACAGNTMRMKTGTNGFRDHPRVCGEYAIEYDPLLNGAGSPPRVRGIRTKSLSQKPLARITPACAGNTASGKGMMMNDGDHPRVCGEYAYEINPYCKHLGSPPRVRGIPTNQLGITGYRRITPACAGNTMLARKMPSKRKDHPRVCGEYPTVKLKRAII